MTSARGSLFAVGCALVLVATAGLGGGPVSLAAPFVGSAWTTADAGGGPAGAVGEATAGPERVESPYGPATVRYDRNGVPHVSAADERALYYAVGYVQARDRLFEMDLLRRLMEGRLAAVFGERALSSDRFHRRMDFERAARASWRALRDTREGALLRAYAAGANRSIERGPLPVEFSLLSYEPAPWTPVDSLLVGKQIAWSLTGDFRDLRAAVVADRLPAATALYPDRLDHDATVLPGWTPPGNATSAPGPVADRRDGRSDALDGAPAGTDTDPPLDDGTALYADLRPYQRAPGVGSNSWVVAGEHTGSGRPILANDPHLSLRAPPVWYEQRVTVAGEDGYSVRGVAIPGAPPVVIGRNRRVAWGVTNAGADVTDLYAYVDNGTHYRYGGEWRAFERHAERIEVDGAPNVTVTVERTVHGPVVEREGTAVAVAWTGLTATRELAAVRGLNAAGDLGDVRTAVRDFDVPTQNLVVATAGGRIAYRATGRYPVRYTDGRAVRGDRVFNGSAREGEWRGFTPYGRSNWSGFVPFGAVPHAVDPVAGYLASANQRVADDPGFYLSTARRYANPYRGARIRNRLEARIDANAPVTPAFVRDLQRDTYSRQADALVGVVANATGAMDARTRRAARRLSSWDRRMERDSRAALLFALFRDRFANATFGDEFRAAGLDASYFPRAYVLQSLPADSPWFDDRRTEATETRADVVARTLRDALDAAERNGWTTYGDYNRPRIAHPFDVALLNYPAVTTDGGRHTVFNVDVADATGSSWRMVAVPGGPGSGVLPGGQSGNPFSPHYDDQLDMWADGEYKPLALSTGAGVAIRFVEADAEGAS